MIVRAATIEDVPLLAGIAARAYRWTFGPIVSKAVLDQRGPAFFRRRFRDALPSLAVAVDADRPVGFVLVTLPNVDMLFVDPPRIGSGAGHKLLAHAESIGARTLECFRDNHAARAFYERQGWRMTRHYERDFVGERHVFVWFEKPDVGEPLPPA